MPTALLLFASVCATSYALRAALGDGLVPMGEALALLVKIAAITAAIGSIAAAAVRQHARVRATMRGRALVVPSKAQSAAPTVPPWLRPAAFAIIIGLGIASFFDDAIEWRAQVASNAHPRTESLVRFVTHRPFSSHVEEAVDQILRDPDYVRLLTRVTRDMPEQQRPRVVARLLARVAEEPAARAMDALAQTAIVLPEPALATPLRRSYAERVAGPILAAADSSVPDGGRSLLAAFVDAIVRKRDDEATLGIVVAAPDAQSAPHTASATALAGDEVDDLARRLGNGIAARVPFAVRIDPLKQFPRRIELRWRTNGDDLLVYVRLTGGDPAYPFEGEYPTHLKPGAGLALEEEIAHDLVP